MWRVLSYLPSSNASAFWLGVCAAGSAPMKVLGRFYEQAVMCSVPWICRYPCSIQGKHYSEDWVTVCQALHCLFATHSRQEFKEMKVMVSMSCNQALRTVAGLRDSFIVVNSMLSEVSSVLQVRLWRYSKWQVFTLFTPIRSNDLSQRLTEPIHHKQ